MFLSSVQFYSLKEWIHVHVKVVTGNTKCGFLLYANLNRTALLYWIYAMASC